MQMTRARSAASVWNRRRRALIQPARVGGERECPKRGPRKGLSTVAGRAGGPACSSDELFVMKGERRGRVIRGCVRSINRKFSGRSRVGELKSPGKPFEISKRVVWEAWEKVKANKGAPGVDGVSIEEFEKDLRGNLY